MGEIADEIIKGPEPDKFQKESNGRVFADEYGIATCATCKRTNIKRSKAGNLYCGDLCWLEKNDDKIHGQDDGEPPYGK